MHAWQVEDLTKELGPKDYQTSTRGARSVEPPEPWEKVTSSIYHPSSPYHSMHIAMSRHPESRAPLHFLLNSCISSQAYLSACQ